MGFLCRACSRPRPLYDVRRGGLITAKAAWLPDQITPDDYVVDLGANGTDEVMGAIQAFNALDKDGDAVDATNFNLTTVGKTLAQASAEVYHGKGFCVVRGLDSKNLSDEDNVLAFLGISSHVGGDLRGVQDKLGNVLTHVTDSKRWSIAPEKRHGIHTNTGLPFHTDMGATVLALHVRQLAQAGGNTYLAPAATIFEHIRAEYPEAAKTLMEPQWPVQITGNPPRHILVALVQEVDGKIMMSLDPGRLGLYDGHLANHANNRAHGAIPGLNDAQRHAFQVLNEVAQTYRLRLDLQVGDMLFINNWTMLHARDHYIDGESSRHLVRLWLHDSTKDWEIPPVLRIPWEAAFGIDGEAKTSRAKGQRIYAIVPPAEYKMPRYAVGSASFTIEDEDA
ncbi:Clavaminate synthase-like protein [Thozetella sp. PMI_491]|nr:Clavaminate synthase-like protein [Thozetella sp. PMI_491]